MNVNEAIKWINCDLIEKWLPDSKQCFKFIQVKSNSILTSKLIKIK